MLLFSPLTPFRQFGIVTGITILFALVVAVAVVPPLLVVWAAYHEWRTRERADAEVLVDSAEAVRDDEVPQPAPDASDGTEEPPAAHADHTIEAPPASSEPPDDADVVEESNPEDDETEPPVALGHDPTTDSGEDEPPGD